MIRLVGSPAVRAGLVAMTLAVLCHLAAAQNYPSRPIRLVSASAPGSGSDVVARLLSTRLSENLGQQIVIDNRAGASGLIGAEVTARAVPDGHTFWIATLSQLISTTLANRLQLAHEFASVGLIATTPFIIVASNTLPIKSAAEFIAYAKSRPGQLMFGSSGTGTTPHVCLELFQAMAGLKLLHVPYKGMTGAMTDVMSGQIHAACPAAPSMTLFGGRVRVLGVTSPGPTALAPGVPPISDVLPGYEMPGWYGVLAPLGTPKPIIARINQEFAKTVNAPDMRERLLAAGAEPAMSSPEGFAAFLRRESERIGKLLKDAGVQSTQ
ncbi:MAG TPA: tripartite tricarboxylate transporter substrate-binding protein [Burkholderiales bacterium]|nr:tripartite tricarboxylate transporter substrate-binding protein [Burkholderiales bacterium]